MNVYFSEYVEGSSNNKAVEIYNAGGSSVDLSNCSINVYSNGNTTPNGSSPVTLSGTLAAGDTYVVCNSSFALGDAGAICQQMSSGINFNGNDAVELVCNSTTMDVIGQIGYDPGSDGWGDASSEAAPLATTKDHTLRRRCSVTSGDVDGSDAFDPATEWMGYAKDTFDGLGQRSCPGNP